LHKGTFLGEQKIVHVDEVNAILTSTKDYELNLYVITVVELCHRKSNGGELSYPHRF
jgi:hypothetical protein